MAQEKSDSHSSLSMSALGVRDEYAIAAGAIGDSGVGKSTMVYSLEKWRAWNPDTDFPLGPTIGVNCSVLRFVLRLAAHPRDIPSQPCVDVKVTLWDTAGQERFKSVTGAYYRSLQVVFLVFDITRADTFAHLKEHWHGDAQRLCMADPIYVVVGNKSDLIGGAEVTEEEAKAWATTIGAHAAYFCSATTWTTEALMNPLTAAVAVIVEREAARRRECTLGARAAKTIQLQEGVEESEKKKTETCDC